MIINGAFIYNEDGVGNDMKCSYLIMLIKTAKITWNALNCVMGTAIKIVPLSEPMWRETKSHEAQLPGKNNNALIYNAAGSDIKGRLSDDELDEAKLWIHF